MVKHDLHGLERKQKLRVEVFSVSGGLRHNLYAIDTSLHGLLEQKKSITN